MTFYLELLELGMAPKRMRRFLTSASILVAELHVVP